MCPNSVLEQVASSTFQILSVLSSEPEMTIGAGEEPKSRCASVDGSGGGLAAAARKADAFGVTVGSSLAVTKPAGALDCWCVGCCSKKPS